MKSYFAYFANDLDSLPSALTFFENFWGCVTKSSQVYCKPERIKEHSVLDRSNDLGNMENVGV